MSVLPLHSELPINETWDLNLLYADINDWENDFNSLENLVTEFNSYRGKLAQSPEVLAEAFQKSDKLYRHAEKIYCYAHLKADENTADSKNRARLGMIESKFAEISGSTSWFEPEFMSINEQTITYFLNSEKLAFYRKSIEELLRERAHVLSEKEERLLGLGSDAMNSAGKIFSTLNNADLTFPEINDEDKHKTELTHGNYIRFMESGNRTVRKRAFTTMFDTYKKYRNTMAATLDGTVKRHVFNAKIRNFPSALEASLFSDNIPVSVYNNLIGAVHDKLPHLHHYLKIRQKALKIRKMDMFDIYNPLVPNYRKEVNFEQAAEWVKAALLPLGNEYQSILEKAFNDRWIDIRECKGKRSGAYSSGCYDSVPYILLNYNNTLNDVFTLAHELGHSMHSYYSNHAQDYHYANYSIFVAEVASTTNEILLHEYLMKQNSDSDWQTYLLCHLADGIRGTIYRQTMFAEFEKHIHELGEKSVTLTADQLCQDYYKLNQKYFGTVINADRRIEMEWARIPHFYYNFYVYKYATGMSAAIRLSQNILEQGNDGLQPYLGFLRAGDSKDVLDIMKDAGVDLTTPEPIHAALDKFAETVCELETKL
ncbi:MAG: oligoendopeptidase F [Victivallaceae bacterium]|nr:oligoendopeptidase F [Victivallaceae bacterium]MDD3702648.1 oligoendopeptidase F [Victivallaceae bacterium]MDD5663143.1 oligoendopeptidase F [Victivallaceae bacterium]